MTVDEAIKVTGARPGDTTLVERAGAADILAEEVERLREEIERLRGEISCEFIRITNVDGLTVLRPILAMVQKEGSSFVASCPAPVVSASGDTQDEAMEMLKDMIVQEFEVLTKQESVLSNHMQDSLAILRRFVATGEAEDLDDLFNPWGRLAGGFAANLASALKKSS